MEIFDYAAVLRLLWRQDVPFIDKAAVALLAFFAPVSLLVIAAGTVSLFIRR